MKLIYSFHNLLLFNEWIWKSSVNTNRITVRSFTSWFNSVLLHLSLMSMGAFHTVQWYVNEKIFFFYCIKRISFSLLIQKFPIWHTLRKIIVSWLDNWKLINDLNEFIAFFFFSTKLADCFFICGIKNIELNNSKVLLLIKLRKSLQNVNFVE